MNNKNFQHSQLCSSNKPNKTKAHKNPLTSLTTASSENSPNANSTNSSKPSSPSPSTTPSTPSYGLMNSPNLRSSNSSLNSTNPSTKSSLMRWKRTLMGWKSAESGNTKFTLAGLQTTSAMVTALSYSRTARFTKAKLSTTKDTARASITIPIWEFSEVFSRTISSKARVYKSCKTRQFIKAISWTDWDMDPMATMLTLRKTSILGNGNWASCTGRDFSRPGNPSIMAFSSTGWNTARESKNSSTVTHTKANFKTVDSTGSESINGQTAQQPTKARSRTVSGTERASGRKTKPNT